MHFKKFEDIIAWQKGKELAICIYRNFKESKEWDFKDQIFRAAVSITNNIAEGFDRSSDNEFKRFLNISAASCSEVRSMLYLAVELNFITPENFELLKDKSNEVSRIIRGLIKSIK